jgi:hypothetical protein
MSALYRLPVDHRINGSETQRPPRPLHMPEQMRPSHPISQPSTQCISTEQYHVMFTQVWIIYFSFSIHAPTLPKCLNTARTVITARIPYRRRHRTRLLTGPRHRLTRFLLTIQCRRFDKHWDGSAGSEAKGAVAENCRCRSLAYDIDIVIR